MNTAPIVSRVWSFCTTLRDDGVGYGDYLEQLTYLIFLKMADEYARPPYNRDVGIDGDDIPSFLPVEVVPEPASPPGPSAASDGRIEIALSSGHRVSASGSFDVDALCRVVRALGG